MKIKHLGGVVVAFRKICKAALEDLIDSIKKAMG